MRKPVVKKLANGVRVLMVPQPDAATVTALILVGTGSKYETKDQNGIAHFLEHMCFKGTDRFPTARAIAEYLDRRGALSNAFTTPEYTGYYVKGNPQHLGIFADLLGDIYMNSTFPEGEIAKEAGVIIEEINMYEDMPQQKVAQLLLELMYGDQPAGWSILGTKETVRSITKKDLEGYKRAHYHADNTIVVVSGAFDQRQIFADLKTIFNPLDKNSSKRKQKTDDTQTTLAVRVVQKQSDQTHIAIGFRSIPLGHPDAPALSLLATILGRGMSSRLFQLLREELGVAYYVNAGQEAFSDHGVFEIAAGVDTARVGYVCSHIAHVLADIKETLISKEELAKAVEYNIGMLRLGLESSDDIAGFYGAQYLLKGTLETPEILARKYRAVTSSDIRRLARKLFVSKRANLVILGPVNESDLDTKPFLSL